jgi:hypothetical protein
LGRFGNKRTHRSKLDRNEIFTEVTKARGQMLTESQQNALIATACLAVLVFAAFAGAYVSGPVGSTVSSLAARTILNRIRLRLNPRENADKPEDDRLLKSLDDLLNPGNIDRRNAESSWR